MKLTFILLLFSLYTCAQEHNIWYFGSHAGIDFNGNTPTALYDGQINTSEGVASIADSEGNLLFYTDGKTIWNKNHQVMENGNGLMGHHSATQSALIIQKPGSQQHFHVFTVTAWGEPNGLRYSSVDMTVNAGLGAVTDKNILLQTPVAEALNATWHNNGEDIWVVVHGFDSNVFSAYLVTSSGVSVNPVTSTSAPSPDPFGQSSIKISPNGSKLAFTRLNWQNGLQLYDFDNLTGLISNPVLLYGPGCYSTEFSASGNILYMTRIGSLWQYDLLATDIAASGLIINSNTSVWLGAIQRGPDNKIYVARNLQDYISVINDPEILGLGCNFEEVGISWDTNSIPSPQSNNGLPNTILASVLRINYSNQAMCIGEPITFSINLPSEQFDTMFWEFGDGNTSQESNPIHYYQQEGTYTVKLTADRQGTIKTVELNVAIMPNPQIIQPVAMVVCDEIGNGTATFNLATQNNVIIGGQESGDYIITYHLSVEDAESGSDSIAENFTNTTNPQTIFARLEAINSGCYAVTSFDLIVNPNPVIAMADSFPICEGDTTVLEVPGGFETYHWSTGESSRSIIVNAAGIYTVTVTATLNGVWCESTKTITVYESAPPLIRHIDTTEWTTNQNTITVSVYGSGNYEYSIDGITYQDSPEFERLESGIYNVYARDKNGCGIDIKEVILLMYPKFFTPNGDGINDTWHIPYSWFEKDMKIYIFDRYGKIISSFTSQEAGWDGNYKGRALPSTDYWFIIERKDGKQYRGHFSMIR